MTNLEEWWGVLKAYDDANKLPIADQERLRDATIQALDTSMHAFRRLLAVAVAAVELRDYQNSIGGHTIPNNREVEHLMGLHEKYLEALKALDQT